MKRTTPKLTKPLETEDAALFRSAVGMVNPLPEQNRVITSKPRKKTGFRPPDSRSEVSDTLSDFVTGDTLEEYLVNGLSRMSLRKLRQGTWPVLDRLDLHGLHTDEARKILQEFLHDAEHNYFRCVLVIHGKGMNSPVGEGVLRKLTRHWLAQHSAVLGFCNAPPREGGSGAVLVLLKTNR